MALAAGRLPDVGLFPVTHPSTEYVAATLVGTLSPIALGLGLGYAAMRQNLRVVQNLDDKARSVAVGARAANVTLTGGQACRVEVGAGRRVEVRFPVEAPSAGTARFHAVAASGRSAPRSRSAPRPA